MRWARRRTAALTRPGHPDAHTIPDGRVIPLSLACRASLAGHLDSGDLLEVTRAAWTITRPWFGLDQLLQGRRGTPPARAYLGRDEFFAGIRGYLIRHSWDSAALTDLRRAVESSSGKDLGDWSRAWLQTAGPNTLRPDSSVNDHGELASFGVLRQAPDQHPVLRPHCITIGLYQPPAPP